MGLMTAKTMAEVLAEHHMSHADWDETEVAVICHCGVETVGQDDGQEAYLQEEALYAKHLEAALSAAGFGLVADAKAEALEEAADELDRQERFGRLPWNDLTDEQRAEYLSWARLETNQAFLRARAKSLRVTS